ncbi:356_t:CDS:2 [Funneliformis caledonium]|uniref:356_t:CDS:1 n=1 Tax=Funneliformis caledonium TaxID=1117310 RepID=A0A9N8WIV4_9GLOM|nr:356_t:CDS:2 [Funneliformis caledonium]
MFPTITAELPKLGKTEMVVNGIEIQKNAFFERDSFWNHIGNFLLILVLIVLKH